jgi:arylsulfatase A-like enzyme
MRPLSALNRFVAIVPRLVLLAITINCAGVSAICGPGNAAQAADRPPNIVLILVDDLGRPDMSCEGSAFHETPNIDRLAARAMRFSNGFAACQVCSPSRAAIQTGKYPPRLQITDYIGAPQPAAWKRNTKLLPAPYQLQLALEETTLAEGLKTVGYQTFFAGKWHLGSKGFLPTDQGYDLNRGGHAPGSPPGGFFSPYKNPQLEDGPPGELLPLRLGRETADFIKQSQTQSDKPFLRCFRSTPYTHRSKRPRNCGESIVTKRPRWGSINRVTASSSIARKRYAKSKTIRCTRE